MSLVSSKVECEDAMDGEERKDEYGVAYANGWVESGLGWDSRSGMEVGEDTGMGKLIGGLKGGMVWRNRLRVGGGCGVGEADRLV